jgi:hypothetical protein
MFVTVSKHKPVAVGTRGGRSHYTVRPGKRWIVRLTLWLFARKEKA